MLDLAEGCVKLRSVLHMRTSVLHTLEGHSSHGIEKKWHVTLTSTLSVSLFELLMFCCLDEFVADMVVDPDAAHAKSEHTQRVLVCQQRLTPLTDGEGDCVEVIAGGLQSQSVQRQEAHHRLAVRERAEKDTGKLKIAFNNNNKAKGQSSCTVSWGFCQPCIRFQAPQAILNLTSDLQVLLATYREHLSAGRRDASGSTGGELMMRCSAKRRRLMFEAEVDISENSNTSSHHDWPSAPSRPPLPAQPSSSAPPQPCPAPHSPQPSSTLPRPDPESSCMEIEAAQRRLQEIEDRITLEDDDEDEDLDVEPAPRRPVLVMSDSLKEGLQRGISDILPHTVAQSVYRKVSLQKQHKKQTVSRLPPTPCPLPPLAPPRPSSPPADTHSSLYSFPVALTSGEEDMEM
ncbi:hypothetical protein F7725_012582 [Dissostichus mawsoni]|uniref:Uncharacterized protein n=1 Tax=Dissostichus mawsoni TaxID=36200 RepID=A0A7J5YN46_DISMA|nr:hypothetical protein F7725_012582 [Dissostichus mawsoni]